MTNHRKLAVLLLTPAMLALSACDLMPVEDVQRMVPVVQQETAFAYATTTVARRDVILQEQIAATYVPLCTDALSFQLGGELVEEMYVQKGDYVTEGQLLAQLKMDNVQARIEECERTLKGLELERGYLVLEQELAAERIAVQYADRQPQLQEALERSAESYRLQMQTLDDQIRLQQLTMQQLKSDLAERQIRAPFSGNITYQRKFAEGERSVLGDRVFTLVDSSLSVFRADTTMWPLIKEGQQYDVKAYGDIYSATVTTPEALGLPAQEMVEGKSAFVYLKPEGIPAELNEGDRATFNVVLDARYDVLTVPSKAVATIDGQTVVYYVRADGTKGYKPVVTGLQTSQWTEIISGLEDGEEIVIP